MLRQALTGLGLIYVAAIQSTTKVRPVCDDPKPPRVSVEALGLSLPKRAWRTVAWREGTNVKLRSRFARVRVRAAPIRPQRHVPNSIATIRLELAAAIANRLQRCPHCMRRIRGTQRWNL